MPSLFRDLCHRRRPEVLAEAVVGSAPSDNTSAGAWGYTTAALSASSRPGANAPRTVTSLMINLDQAVSGPFLPVVLVTRFQPKTNLERSRFRPGWWGKRYRTANCCVGSGVAVMEQVLRVPSPSRAGRPAAAKGMQRSCCAQQRQEIRRGGAVVNVRAIKV